MTMVVSNQQRIFYRFEGDKGAYLLLHHGLFGSHADWYQAGYVDALREEFRLIVPDARGHGRSDHPLEPERYRLAQFADDVIAIMDELEIRNLHFCGYSLGALVGFELLMRYPDRVRIVMLAGESPFVSEPMREGWRRLAEDIRSRGLAQVRAAGVAEQVWVARAPLSEQEGEQQAALALLEGLAAETPRPDEGRISVDSPVALFVGEADAALERMREARRRIHRARFVSFPGQTHGGLFDQREALIAEMLRLLRPGRRGGEEGEGRERSGRGRQWPQGEVDGTPLHSAPLTPPPPVDVPPRAESEPVRLGAPAPAEVAEIAAIAAIAAIAEAAAAPSLSAPAETPAPLPSAPPAGVGAAGEPSAAPPSADPPPPQADPSEPAAAPEDIPVRARWPQGEPPADEHAHDPWEPARELAPPVPGGAVEAGPDDEGDDGGEAQDEDPRDRRDAHEPERD